MVIENHPRLEDGSPFPTLFWLTCPVLAGKVSGLESVGHMQVLADELASDGSMHDRFESSIDRYRARRDSHEVISDSGGPPGGGPDRVKCLHAHVAHELADPPNPVGALTLAAARWPDCRVPCVKSS
jgi:hypothetical protein